MFPQPHNNLYYPYRSNFIGPLFTDRFLDLQFNFTSMIQQNNSFMYQHFPQQIPFQHQYIYQQQQIVPMVNFYSNNQKIPSLPLIVKKGLVSDPNEFTSTNKNSSVQNTVDKSMKPPKVKKEEFEKKETVHSNQLSESFQPKKPKVLKRKKIQRQTDSDQLTKNIPKNISKGLKKYIICQKQFILKCLDNNQNLTNEFLECIKSHDLIAYSVRSFQDIWLSLKNPEFRRVLRIVGQKFLKRDFPSYIYNSHIKSRKIHLSYRHRFTCNHEEENNKQ